MKLQSGHEVEPLGEEEMKRQNRDWGGYPKGLVRLTPGKWILPTDYKRFADGMYNFKFKESDVVIMTYPKCGTTWTQEIVWTMRNNPNLDNPEGTKFIFSRSPFLDFDILLHTPKGPPPKEDPMVQAFMQLCPGKDPADGINLQLAQAIPDPRTIKTHLPFSLMHPDMLDKTKVIYVARNPKDVIISYHHHCRINFLHDYLGTFEEFVQYFVDDEVVYGPYWLHLKEAWQKKEHPNLHIIFFEDMKANPIQELRRLDKFLNTKLTETQMENIAEYTSFSEMTARMKASGFNENDMPLFKRDVIGREGGFFRKGASGDWKGKFTPELMAKVDEWIQKYMSSFGVSFKYSV